MLSPIILSITFPRVLLKRVTWNISMPSH